MYTTVVEKGIFSMDLPHLKRKIIKLKQFEKTIRAHSKVDSGLPLVWDKFFDQNNNPNSPALYSLSKLETMSREEYKRVVDDFIARIYYEIYIHKGLISETIYDPKLLSMLDLPAVADEQAVKKKFRELAKQYHPDAGGNHEKFIEMMKIYRELVG